MGCFMPSSLACINFTYFQPVPFLHFYTSLSTSLYKFVIQTCINFEYFLYKLPIWRNLLKKKSAVAPLVNLCDVSHIFSFRISDTTIWNACVPNLFYAFSTLRCPAFSKTVIC